MYSTTLLWQFIISDLNIQFRKEFRNYSFKNKLEKVFIPHSNCSYAHLMYCDSCDLGSLLIQLGLKENMMGHCCCSCSGFVILLVLGLFRFCLTFFFFFSWTKSIPFPSVMSVYLLFRVLMVFSLSHMHTFQ